MKRATANKDIITVSVVLVVFGVHQIRIGSVSAADRLRVAATGAELKLAAADGEVGGNARYRRLTCVREVEAMRFSYTCTHTV